MKNSIFRMLVLAILLFAGLFISGCEGDSGDSGGSGGGTTVTDACLNVSNGTTDAYVRLVYIKSYINVDDIDTYGTEWLSNAGYDGIYPGYYLDFNFQPGTYDILVAFFDIGDDLLGYVFRDNEVFDSDETNTIYIYKSGETYYYQYYFD